MDLVTRLDGDPRVDVRRYGDVVALERAVSSHEVAVGLVVPDAVEGLLRGPVGPAAADRPPVPWVTWVGPEEGSVRAGLAAALEETAAVVAGARSSVADGPGRAFALQVVRGRVGTGADPGGELVWDDPERRGGEGVPGAGADG